MKEAGREFCEGDGRIDESFELEVRVMPKMLILKRLVEHGMSIDEAMRESNRIARENPDLCSRCASRLDSIGECPEGCA